MYPQGPSLALRPWVVASACPHQQTQPCPLPPDPSGTGRRTAASRSQNSCYPEMCVVLESLFLVSCDLGEKTRWKARGAGRGEQGERLPRSLRWLLPHICTERFLFFVFFTLSFTNPHPFLLE